MAATFRRKTRANPAGVSCRKALKAGSTKIVKKALSPVSVRERESAGRTRVLQILSPLL